MQDIFTDEQDRPRVLRGVTVISGSTRLAEMAGRIGFDAVWIDLEHGTPGYTEAEALCVACETGGAIPTLRIQDAQRTHVLRALEIGARIVVVPMVNDAATARQVVAHGKFPPLGARGYNTRSRGVAFGLEDCERAFGEANERTYLFTQVETMTAVENLSDICRVEGLAGIFIGPGDLSVSAGKTGKMNDPEMIRLVADCVRRARGLGKHAGILVGPGPMLDAAMAAGCDLVFCGGDLTNLATAWRDLLAAVRTDDRGG
jgi:2-keto-3-deoxy-L-rhamnonate aldolase RhmA